MKALTLPDLADFLVGHFLVAQAAGQLRPENRAALSSGVEKLLRAQLEGPADPDVFVCGICEQALTDPAIELSDELVLCATCAVFWSEAQRQGGTVLRSRCKPVCSPAPATCGRVWRIQVVPGRSGPIVADTDSACLECRPAQQAAMERILAADAARLREG